MACRNRRGQKTRSPADQKDKGAEGHRTTGQKTRDEGPAAQHDTTLHTM